MGYKSILVPLEESDVLPSVLATALLVARQFDSYVEGLCIRPSLAGAIAVGFEGGVAALAGTEEQFEQEQETRTRRLQEHFDGFVRDSGLTVVQHSGVLRELKDRRFFRSKAQKERLAAQRAARRRRRQNRR